MDGAFANMEFFAVALTVALFSFMYSPSIAARSSTAPSQCRLLMFDVSIINMRVRCIICRGLDEKIN